MISYYSLGYGKFSYVLKTKRKKERKMLVALKLIKV
jgi:hypothetical protein